MKEFKEEFWKETSKLMDAHRKDNDERAAQGVVDCRILFTRLVKNLTIPRVSGSLPATHQTSVINELKNGTGDYVFDGTGNER